MDFATLKEELLQGYEKQSRRFHYEPTASTAAEIQRLFAQVGVDALRLEQVRKPVERKELLQIQGQIALMGLTKAQATLSVQVVENAPQLVLTILLPPEWTFAATFPELAHSCFEALTLATDESARPSRLILSSYAHQQHREDGSALSLAVGINLDVTLAVNQEPLTTAARLFPEVATLTFSGGVEASALGPNMVLRCEQELAPRVSFSTMDLDFGLALRSHFEPHEQYRLQEQGLVVSTTLTLDGRAMHLSTMLTSKPLGILNLHGDFTDVALPSPEALATLIGAKDVEGLLPPFLPQNLTIAINGLTLGLNPASAEVAYIFLYLGALEKTSWEVIPDHLSLANVALDLRVYQPFSSHRQASLQLTAEIDVPVGQPILQLDAFAQAPAFALQATLREETTFHLTDLITHFIPVAADVPDLIFNNLLLEMTESGGRRQMSLAAAFADEWQLALPGGKALTVDDVAFQLQRTGDGFRGDIAGTVHFAGTEMMLKAAFEEHLTFTGRIPEISLSALMAEVGELALPPEVPDFTLADVEVAITPQQGEFSLRGHTTTAWALPIGIDDLIVRDIAVTLQRTSTGGAERAVTGVLTGTIQIGTVALPITFALPGAFELRGHVPVLGLSSFVQEICGADAIRTMSLPPTILTLELHDLTCLIAPQRRELALFASSSFGQVELIVKQMAGGEWGFAVGIVPPANWRFSTIDPALTVLDPLNFAGSALVLASAADRSLTLSTISLSTTEGQASVKRGLNFFAQLDMRGLGVDELLGVDALQVYAAIGTNPRDLVIEAALAGQFTLAENVAFGNITFRLQPSPTDFSLILLGTVTATLDESPLEFVGGLGIRAIVTPPSFQAQLQATMLGLWDRPFGTDGVAIADIALDLAIGFPPLRPAIGLAGTLQIGDFKGAAAVRIDTINPSKSMLAIAFNRLYLVDVLRTFTPPAIHEQVPTEIAETVLNVGFEDVNIYIVPQPTTIGELTFEQGISLKGRMIIWGLHAFGQLSIDQTTGVLVEGDLDAINIAGLFQLTGAGGREKAYLLLDLRAGSRPMIQISGAVELLGIRREVEVNVSDTGFYFAMSGELFGLFEAAIEVRGGNLDDATGIFIKATMRNDLLAYLREEATKAIRAAADEAMAEIADAQQALTAAQQEVQRLNDTIAAMRQTIQRERERDIRRLQEAQAAVTAAQNEVQRLNREIQHMRQLVQQERNRDAARLRDAGNAVQQAQDKVDRLDRDINAMRQTIRGERSRDEGRLRRAREDVQGAQQEVNKLQGEINSTKRRIKEIDSEIRAKKRWLDQKAWYDKIWAGPEYAAFESAKRIEQGALYTKIAGIEAAKHTALGVLEIAKQTLRGMEAAAKTFPIDADPRIAALFAARETANGVLEAAKQTMRGMEAAAKTIPIDADPRVAALFAARETANGVLEAAKQTVRGMEAAAKTIPINADPRIVGLFGAGETANGALEVAKLSLEGVRQAVGALAEVGEYIVQFGLGGLLDIREATFEAALTAASGGHVSLMLVVSFMGKSQRLAVAFNFHDPLRGALALAEQLLPE